MTCWKRSNWKKYLACVQVRIVAVGKEVQLDRSSAPDTHTRYVAFEKEPISFTVSEVTDSFSLPPITFPKQSFQMVSNWRQCTRIFLFASPFDSAAAPNPFNILELGQFIEECRFQLGLKAKFGD
jgi:hypothetical protein